MQIADKYAPQEIEQKWYDYWERHGLFHSEPDAREPYTVVIPPPNVTGMVNREVVGIVTKIDDPEGDPERAAAWLRLTGCEKIFYVSSVSGEGITEIFDYLKEDGDVLPWETENKQ